MLVNHPEVVGGPKKKRRFLMREDGDWDDPDYGELDLEESTVRLAQKLGLTPPRPGRARAVSGTASSSPA
jgi:hypothetical protein